MANNKKSDDYEIDVDVLNDNMNKTKKSRTKILEELKEMDSYEIEDLLPAKEFLPSNLLKTDDGKPVSKKKKDIEEQSQEVMADDWFNRLNEFTSLTFDTSKKYKGIDYNPFEDRKKKKKKNKNKNGEVDYKKEFAPEMSLYKSLLVEQNRFTDSLQKEYDAIKSVKSSSRGVSKQLSDLIENITEARSLSMQLVDKHVNAKKLIAELNLKQKKELAITDENGDMTGYASTLLKQMLQDRSQFLQNNDITVNDYSEEDPDLINIINDELIDEEENDEYTKRLKYENRNVTVYVVITDNDVDNYEFQAQADDGEILYDYPMPIRTKISINPSTNIATNQYGEKFNIIYNFSSEQ